MVDGKAKNIVVLHNKFKLMQMSFLLFSLILVVVIVVLLFTVVNAETQVQVLVSDCSARQKGKPYDVRASLCRREQGSRR